MAEKKLKFSFLLNFIFFLGASSVYAFPLSLHSNPEEIEIVSIEKNPISLAILTSTPEPLDFIMETESRIYLVAKPQDLNFLLSSGLIFRLETPFFAPARPSKEMSLTSGGNGIYHSYNELIADLKKLAEKFPSLCRLEDLGRSLEGRQILALKISDNVNLNEPEPGFLFLGCHHAREWISVEVPLYLGLYLVENYALNPRVQNLVNEAQIWIIPLVNPDGLEYSIKFYRYWRKNRRLNSDGSFGVDLNRNYGFNWGIDNRGSSPNPASETYRGMAPFSEPETRAVRDLFSNYQFQALISYHSYSQIILFPWGFTVTPADKYQLLFNLAKRMSDLMASVHGRRYDFGQASTMLYLTNGDTTDWAYGTRGIPAFTIELPPVDIFHGGFFNSERDIQPIFEENLAAALDLIQWGIDNYKFAESETKRKEKNLIPLIIQRERKIK